MSPPSRKPHAVLDLISRKRKAEKIERLLKLSAREGGLDLLEVGTGSGGIAHYFGISPHLRCRVTSVDVVDSRVESEGYRFIPVSGTHLPLPDSSFDVVLSNHVIEHVGDRGQQKQHLLELKRVLRKQGQGYLAFPNRWMLVEPHYRLPLLSWWPSSMRSTWLRWFRGEPHYDCEPLSLSETESLLNEVGFAFENIGDEAAHVMRALEPTGWGLACYLGLPARLRSMLRFAMPTLIYRIRHPARGLEFLDDLNHHRFKATESELSPSATTVDELLRDANGAGG